MTVVVAVVIWIAIGLVIATVMIRRGHSPVVWLSLSPYGPLAGLLALSARDTEAAAGSPELLATGRPGSGPVDVLVGVDGSAESLAAARAVPDLLGDRLGRVVLASVLDYDVSQLPGRARPREDAEAVLEAAAGSLRADGTEPGTVLLSGEVAASLLGYARREGFTLVAAGRRGAGASSRILGSAATHLASSTDLPVLLVGPAGTDDSTTNGTGTGSTDT